MRCKVITYVKKELDKSWIKQDHEIRKGYSVNEEFDRWSHICHMALNQGLILDYQVEIKY